MRNKGFTLIEMMIVIVVVGILTFVALPAYQNSVLKSNRSAAKGVLFNVASRLEQYFINSKAYTNQLDDLGLPAAYYVDNQADVAPADSAIYLINLSTVGGGYSISAVPQNFQTKDKQCSSFTLTDLGVKAATGSLSATQCW